MSNFLARASRGVLVTAIYITGWYVEGDSGMALQALAVCLVFLAASMSVLSGGVFRIRISSVEQLFGVVFGFAMLVAIVTTNFVSLIYAGMFLALLTALALLVRHEEAELLPGVFRSAYVALLVTVVLVEPKEFLGSLSGTVEYGTGLVRYQPLGMHPNLAGLVYGGGALLFIQYFFLVSKPLKKIFAASMSIFCVFVLFAASARASLLALAVSGLAGIVGVAVGGSVKARLGLIIILAMAMVVVVLKWDSIFSYFSLILDLESETRGLDSGATGRADIWRDGVDLVFSDFILMLTGRGVRAASPEAIGFPVESSYINLALENGIIFAAFIVLTFFKTAWRSIRFGIYRSTVGDYQDLLNGLMLVFVLSQSVFNRYLIAAGNPYSLFVITLMLWANLRTRKIRGA